MDEILNQITSIIPPKYAALLTTLFVASQVLGRILQAIRTGGGLKSILASVWLGTNAPKPNGETSNVQPAESDVPPFRPPLWIFAALVLPIALTACKTPRLEPGGAYAPTNSVGQVVYSDTGLMLSDASYKLAYETVGAVFKFERDNRIAIWKLSPVVKSELDNLRPQVVDIDRRWAMARKTYRSNPTPAGLTAVQSILAEIQRIIPVVQQQMNPIYNKLTSNP